MILLPKGKGGHKFDGMVKVVWKKITTIINTRLRTTISLHDALHIFRQVRGAVTATLEAKRVKQLTVIFHEPLLQVFLDVKKAYESLERMQCMEILWGYGLSDNLKRILKRFWEGHAVVPRARGCYG